MPASEVSNRGHFMFSASFPSAAFPRTITVSTKILETFAIKGTSNTAYKASVVFHATFNDGSQKMLRRVSTYKNSVVIEGEVFLVDSPLYYRDWANVPTFGDWDKNYPPSPLA